MCQLGNMANGGIGRGGCGQRLQELGEERRASDDKTMPRRPWR
jgi:hypothetical protein